MKFQNIIFNINILVILFLVGMWTNPLHAQLKEPEKTNPDELTIQKSWHGEFPVSHLDRLPEGQHDQPIGFINDSETFSDVWKAFKPEEEIPGIDFNTNIVFFARNTQFYNRISIGQVRVNEGIAEILAMETMSAMPIEDKVALSIAVVLRRGIQAIRTGSEIVSIP